jgi:hypothetical protein
MHRIVRGSNFSRAPVVRWKPGSGGGVPTAEADIPFPFVTTLPDREDKRPAEALPGQVAADESDWPKGEPLRVATGWLPRTPSGSVENQAARQGGTPWHRGRRRAGRPACRGPAASRQFGGLCLIDWPDEGRINGQSDLALPSPHSIAGSPEPQFMATAAVYSTSGPRHDGANPANKARKAVRNHRLLPEGDEGNSRPLADITALRKRSQLKR